MLAAAMCLLAKLCTVHYDKKNPWKIEESKEEDAFVTDLETDNTL